MKYIISLVIFLLCISLILPVTAEINVSADAAGTTWITWEWNAGLNVTDIYVDGYKMCGYETTMPSFDIMGLTPCSFHNTTIFTETDNGTNETYTTCGNATIIIGDIGGDAESTGLAFAVLGITIGGVILYKRKRRDDEHCEEEDWDELT